ncbi:RES family NAD+ phosphorylase [Microlunatus elymi]|uniref:RES family NAD+ phosphorylase n=1 Tax=Microlunatus elymi TaxID=2596828 RepID=UPI00143DADD9|nr:RES family NAD+ phosphorylase [Microlunatus elymi]
MPLTLTPADVRTWTGSLLRIAPTQSAHPIPYGALRTDGPVAGQRWDPHPAGPPKEHPPRYGVLYTASTLAAACAETNQSTRMIDRHTDTPVITVWSPMRPLQLLDLGPRSSWLIRHRASASLITRPAPHGQSWARDIVAALGDQIDGLCVPSSMTGTNVVLFGRAGKTFPAFPSNRMPLNDPAIFPLLQKIATKVGYGLL